MNRKQRIIISVIGIFLTLLILTGLTYAYFLTQIKGNTNPTSISVTLANLVLEYEDGNGIIKMEKISPNTTKTKTFTVTNIGNTLIENYVVVLENVVNNFYLRDDLVYTLTCTSVDKETKEISGSCNGVSNIPLPRTDDIIITNNIEAGIEHQYKIKVTYKETDIDQSIDLNKTFVAKINIYDRREKIQYLTDQKTLKTFIENIDKLETLATNYLGDDALSTSTYNKSKAKWLIFSTISKLNYNNSSWTQVAGPENTDFLTYLTDNNFDINIFKNAKYTSSLNGDTSGITHFSAAVAAQLYNTDGLVQSLLNLTEYEINHQASWAGDLQTLINNNLLSSINNQNDYEEIYNKMSELIGKEGTYFDTDDLYADIDAEVIYSSLTADKTIKEIMDSHYSTQLKNRFYNFVFKILKDYRYDYSYENLNTLIYHYTEYNSKWNLYDKSFSTTVAKAAADAFADYLWYLANLYTVDIFSHNLEFKKGETIEFIAEYINKNNLKESNLTNEDYTWTVTNVDGTSCVSNISNGILTIPDEETASELLIKVSLNKSNKVTSTRTIALS